MKKSKRRKLFAVLGGIVLFIVLFVVVNNYCVSVTRGSYVTEKVSGSLRLIAISDLHGKTFGKDNRSLVKQIQKLQPDIIALAGDFVGKDSDLEPTIQLVKGLTGFCDYVYFANGNHELKYDTSTIEEQLMQAGARVLRNSSEEIQVKGNKIRVYGLDLPLYFYSGYDEQGELLYPIEVSKLNEFLGESSDDFNLLIAHNPCYFQAYSAWGADVTVSGHNHGGVIRLPVIKGVFTPNGDQNNKHYDCGEYKINNESMFLSRGLGEWAGPVRAFNLPEIYVIDIKEK